MCVTVRPDNHHRCARQQSDLVAPGTLRRKVGWRSEQVLVAEQEIFHDVGIGCQQGGRGGHGVRGYPADLVNKREQAPGEVPEHRAQRFQPLHAKHHLVLYTLACGR
jgi:hypothetical protein